MKDTEAVRKITPWHVIGEYSKDLRLGMSNIALLILPAYLVSLYLTSYQVSVWWVLIEWFFSSLIWVLSLEAIRTHHHFATWTNWPNSPRLSLFEIIGWDLLLSFKNTFWVALAASIVAVIKFHSLPIVTAINISWVVSVLYTVFFIDVFYAKFVRFTKKLEKQQKVVESNKDKNKLHHKKVNYKKKKRNQ